MTKGNSDIEALYKLISERKAQGKPVNRACVDLVKAFEKPINDIIKVNGFNKVDESDLVLVAHVSILNAIDKYKPGEDASFSTFARRCIENAMRDEQRKVKRKFEQECSLDKMQEDVSFEAEDPSVDIEEKYSKEKRIEAVFAHANEEEKKVLLCIKEGMSYEDIAKKLNISKKKVDNIIQKIRKTEK